MSIYKRDYIYMRRPGGEAQKVDVADIGQKLAQGYQQCLPPEEEQPSKEE